MKDFAKKYLHSTAYGLIATYNSCLWHGCQSQFKKETPIK